MFKISCSILFVSFCVLYFPFVSAAAFQVKIAPDGHRCGICPTYLEKVCGKDAFTGKKFIFDNHCVMDLYNCMEATNFAPTYFSSCVFFGNFAYVHGFKHTDQDYGEDHIIVKGSKKNPDFVI